MGREPPENQKGSVSSALPPQGLGRPRSLSRAIWPRCKGLRWGVSCGVAGGAGGQVRHTLGSHASARLGAWNRSPGPLALAIIVPF